MFIDITHSNIFHVVIPPMNTKQKTLGLVFASLIALIALASLSSCVSPFYQASHYQPSYRTAPVSTLAPTPTAPSASRTTLDLGYPYIKAALYTVRGVRYYPMSPAQALNFRESGISSTYKGGQKTAIGETVNSKM